jgi:hypothetical protein
MAVDGVANARWTTGMGTHGGAGHPLLLRRARRGLQRHSSGVSKCERDGVKNGRHPRPESAFTQRAAFKLAAHYK